MDQNQKSAFQASITPGVILAIVLIIYSLVMYLLDVDRQSALQWVSLVLMAIVLFWSMTTHRNNNLGGNMPYGEGFKVGFLTVLIGGIITAIYTFIFFTVIDPGAIEEILLQSEEQMLERNPEMTDEQIEQAMSFTESLVASPIALTIWGFVFNLFFGVILSLIIAIFAKREAPVDFAEESTGDTPEK